MANNVAATCHLHVKPVYRGAITVAPPVALVVELHVPTEPLTVYGSTLVLVWN
jgi:hypothetical protein